MSEISACVPPARAVFGIPVDFLLFGLTLLGVAVFHRHTMRVALTGLVTIVIYKIAFTGFKTGAGVIGSTPSPASRKPPSSHGEGISVIPAALGSFRNDATAKRNPSASKAGSRE